MRPTTWLNNTRAGRYRATRDTDLGDGRGPGPAQLPQQFGTNEMYYNPTDYSGFHPPHPMFHPAFQRSYSAPDNFSLPGHSHAHGSYHAQYDHHRRPATPYAPSPLGFSGHYGLRPDAIPFDPSSPLVTPSPSPVPDDPTSLNYGAPCYRDCGNDCPFADPYLPGWLERKAKDNEANKSQASPPVTASDGNGQPYSPFNFTKVGWKGANVLAPSWMERMAKERVSRKEMTNTPQASPPASPWSRTQVISPVSGHLRSPWDFSNPADSQSLAISRASTPALHNQHPSTSRTSTPGLSGKQILAARPSTPDTQVQHMTASQPTNMTGASPHVFFMQDPHSGSARPLHQLLQSFNGNSYEHLEKLHQVVKRVENAKNTFEPSYSPCSSSNDSQQSSWSLEDMTDDIQPEDSCSVFISGLPMDVTLSQLLGSIRCGRVRYSKIVSSGALIVFFEKNAAQRLAREGQLDVGEVQAKVQFARTRVAESTLPRGVSRVLVITGFMRGLSITFLKDCLEMKNIQYELEKIVRGIPGDMSTLEWHFASYAQAKKVHDIIMTEPLLCKKGVRATYGIDPCCSLEE